MQTKRASLWTLGHLGPRAMRCLLPSSYVWMSPSAGRIRIPRLMVGPNLESMGWHGMVEGAHGGGPFVCASATGRATIS